jgi:hypothetical protein
MMAATATTMATMVTAVNADSRNLLLCQGLTQ